MPLKTVVSITDLLKCVYLKKLFFDLIESSEKEQQNGIYRKRKGGFVYG